MIRPPPTATRTDTFFPCTTRCRAIGAREANVAPLFGLFRDRGVCRRRPAALEAAPMDQPRDTTDRFTPRFDAAGPVTAIVVDADTRALLMVAHMNDAAIRLPQETGQAPFGSRSRPAPWAPGATSGNGPALAALRVHLYPDSLPRRGGTA